MSDAPGSTPPNSDSPGSHSPKHQQHPANLDHRSLALAGVFAVAQLVHKLAHREPQNDQDLRLRRMLFRATVVRDPDDWAQIFSDLPVLRSAASSTATILDSQRRDRQVLIYGVQLIQLAELLNQQPAVRNRLAELIDALVDDEPTSLAEVYRQSISHLGQRIQVTGNAEALQDTDTASAIRALLLCGVRMGWLWLRLGGKRRQLVFSRKRVTDMLRRCAESLPADPGPGTSP